MPISYGTPAPVSSASVLPTKLPLHEFYREYAGLWEHAVEVRYRREGKLKTHLALVAALATRRVTFTAIRKGMRMGNVLSNPKSFLRAHDESSTRLADADTLERALPADDERIAV